MDLPGPEHFLFVPGVLLIGIVIGYVLGQQAAARRFEHRRRRLRE